MHTSLHAIMPILLQAPPPCLIFTRSSCALFKKTILLFTIFAVADTSIICILLINCAQLWCIKYLCQLMDGWIYSIRCVLFYILVLFIIFGSRIRIHLLFSSKMETSYSCNHWVMTHEVHKQGTDSTCCLYKIQTKHKLAFKVIHFYIIAVAQCIILRVLHDFFLSVLWPRLIQKAIHY